jgi:hypothetical protein
MHVGNVIHHANAAPARLADGLDDPEILRAALEHRVGERAHEGRVLVRQHVRFGQHVKLRNDRYRSTLLVSMSLRVSCRPCAKWFTFCHTSN